ncbi:MAG: ABC transporter substrate-binding protein [Lachnospiraceae bacterium]|jgi:ABC-type glycerol-3-phosphate transport system substrate-binding protein|nr:ABC transporter substrate-binding protein [Lachnospiraceae bacterium]
MKTTKQIQNRAKFSAIILTLLAITISMACNEANDEAASNNVVEHKGIAIADAYIAESYSIDNIQGVHIAAAHGNTIYLSGYEYPPNYKEGDTIADGDANLHLYYIDMDSDETKAIRLPYDHYEVEPTAFISSISINNDESINLVILEYSDDGKKADVSIKRIHRDGTEISRVFLAEDMQYVEYIYPDNIIVDAVGRFYLINLDMIYVWDQQGGLISKISVNGSNVKMSWDYTYEEIYVTWISNDGGRRIAIIDQDSSLLGHGHDLTTMIHCFGMNPGVGSDLLFASEMGVYAYDAKSRNYDEVFSWISVNMQVDQRGKFLPLSDGRVVWVENKLNGVEMHVIRPLREDEEVPEVETLIIGGTMFFIDDALLTAITEFNLNSSRYRVEIKDYTDNDFDIRAGFLRLNLDIVNGKGPDIIVLPSNISMGLYARRGVLTDLYPLIDQDVQMERADFQENIVRAYEIDGQLFGMPVFYHIHTLIAAISEIGDIIVWNLDEMMSYVDNQLPDNQVFDDHSKSGVLSLCLRANGEALVDWTSDESGFQRELFLKMLHFADQFTLDNSFVYGDNMFERIYDEQVRILSDLVNNYSSHAYFSTIFGEQVSYPGFPSESGSGNLISSYSVMSINSNSQHKDAAWEFISSMLTDDFQTREFLISSISFPILNSAHETRIKEAMNMEQPIVYSTSDGNSIDVYGPTENDVRVISNLINSAEKIRIYDEQIINIVMEEAQYFFGGAKSAEEVADIAENRIRIYVNEMK